MVPPPDTLIVASWRMVQVKFHEVKPVGVGRAQVGRKPLAENTVGG